MVAASVFSLSASAAQVGSDRDKVLGLKAKRMIADGRCDEALAEIERARSALQSDAELALLEGQCRIRLADYAGALQPLREAKRLDATLPDADLYLAVALYHLEDFDAARQSIELARGHVSTESLAQLELYTGLLLLRSAEAREAALAFERARLADATQVEPVASYYASLAWQSVNERELAREALERVKAVDKDGEWAQRAEAALAGASFEERSWASVRAGFEYDSNVVLLGNNVEIPSQADDGRAVWFLEGGAELFRGEHWSGGVLADYAGSAHFELNEFDTHYPKVSGWIDRSLGTENLIRLRYEVGHAWVDYESFVTSQSASLVLFRNWGEAGNSELSLAWDWNDYHLDIAQVPASADGTTCPGAATWCAPQGVDSQSARNRDGNGISVALLHRYDVRAFENDFLRSFVVRGGYGYGRYWAEGSDWRHSAHEFQLGFESELPLELKLDVLGGFGYRPFDNSSSYPVPPIDRNRAPYFLRRDDREDKVWRASVLLERPINDFASVSARYFFIRNKSNVTVFDYRRHVVGGYLTLTF